MLSKGEDKMKEKLIVISLYILLAIIVCTVGAYWLFAFAFDDVLNYYYGGILKVFFILIMIAVIALPIIKYRKHQQKWILPVVLCLMMLITPIFNNGILKFVEDDLRMFSKEKWDKYETLRIYMIDDLETHYITKGMSEEFVINLLGEPMYVKEDSPRFIEYYISPGYLDPIRFYIMFEDGEVVETGKHHT